MTFKIMIMEPKFTCEAQDKEADLECHGSSSEAELIH